jgi:hypothetical protein
MANKDSKEQLTDNDNNTNTVKSISVFNSTQDTHDYLLGERITHLFIGENKNIPFEIQENKLFKSRVDNGKYKVVL